MLDTIKRLAREEDGQGMAEYALILVAVAIVCIVGFKAVGNKINGTMENVEGKLEVTDAGNP